MMFGRNKLEIEKLKARVQWHDEVLQALLQHLKLDVGYEPTPPTPPRKVKVYSQVEHSVCLNQPQS
jgi:hypothetical protein